MTTIGALEQILKVIADANKLFNLEVQSWENPGMVGFKLNTKCSKRHYWTSTAHHPKKELHEVLDSLLKYARTEEAHQPTESRNAPLSQAAS